LTELFAFSRIFQSKVQSIDGTKDGTFDMTRVAIAPYSLPYFRRQNSKTQAENTATPYSLPYLGKQNSKNQAENTATPYFLPYFRRQNTEKSG